jgi:hypothetical protein
MVAERGDTAPATTTVVGVLSLLSCSAVTSVLAIPMMAATTNTKVHLIFGELVERRKQGVK